MAGEVAGEVAGAVAGAVGGEASSGSGRSGWVSRGWLGVFTTGAGLGSRRARALLCSRRARALLCSRAGAQVARASFVRRERAPRFRSGRPSSIARGAPPRRAVAESSRRLRPTRQQPTRLPPTRRARRARQRCGCRSRAPGASHDCCGCAAAAVALLRCGCSDAPPLQGEHQLARVSPRRADQPVVRACHGATGGDCCSFAGGQPR